jgi:hypothetical protein
MVLVLALLPDDNLRPRLVAVPFIHISTVIAVKECRLALIRSAHQKSMGV